VDVDANNQRRFAIGILACLDGYMNIALEQTEEYVGGQKKNTFGDAFVRGNNGQCWKACSNSAFLTPRMLFKFYTSAPKKRDDNCSIMMMSGDLFITGPKLFWIACSGLRRHNFCQTLE
jgi:hypothetical protein